jgi:hypothetical protein
MKNIAIVTGASSGLGRDFVHQLDLGAGGPLHEIWLLARDAEKLESVAKQTKTPTKILSVDLTDPASLDQVDSALAAEDDVNVQWLVNCAGFGKFGPFTAIGERGNANMVRLNCLAVVEMCYRSLLHMHAGSRIVNISSVAAFIPQPGLDVYSATKRFVLDFSRGLDAELAGTGIHASAVLPKFMHTNFLSKPGDQQAVSHMTWIGFEDPHACVTKALKWALRGKRTIITSPDMRIMNGVLKVLPVRAGMDLEMALGNLFGGKLSK